MNTIRKRVPSPAMLVACVALVVALGGVSYAASVLPKNSVGAAQLKKRAVTGAKIKNNAVSGAKVKDRTLTAADFMVGQVPAGPQGPKGDKGDAGLPGAKGDKGDPGTPGPTLGSASTTFPSSVPSPAPETSHQAYTITTTAAGSLYVVGRAMVTIDCSSGTARTSLYVDGTPVPASGFQYADAPATRVNTFGVLGAVPAGDHTVSMQTDCVGGNAIGGIATTHAAVGAILLGGS